MNEVRDRQAGFNVASRDQWEGFASHRARVSELLAGGGGAGRLCVLGAGNANDLDLPRLLDTHAGVHLVDIDAEALRLGAERQGVSGRAGLVCHGGLDLTGLADAMGRWTPLTALETPELRALSDWPAGRVALALPGPFEVVASTCVLSQLLDGVYHGLGATHPQRDPAQHAMRLGHLRLLCRLTRPGGRAVLITDVASSEHVPALLGSPESGLERLVAELAGTGRQIRGVHPGDLIGTLRSDPELRRRMTPEGPISPWLWRLHARHYLVCAFSWIVRS